VILPVLVAPDARAQSITAPVMNYYPDRIVPGTGDIGIGPRAQNLNPTGISYDDCAQNQSLQFNLLMSSFVGQDIQVWASKTGDCTNDSNRGNGGIANCWRLNAGSASVNAPTSMPVQFTLRVQDIIGGQAYTTLPTTFPSQTSAACNTQPSYSAVSFTIYFMAISNSLFVSGSTPYEYQLAVDTMGPPPPTGVSPAVGDTLFTVNWNPNTDLDSAGYALFLSPIRGQEGTSGTDASGSPEPTLICPGADASAGMAAMDAGDADASIDGASSPVDAGCYYSYTGGSAPVTSGGSAAGTCPSGTPNDPVLESAFVSDAGAQQVEDDSGEGGLITQPPGGGISTIPPSYAVDFSNGFTAAGVTANSYTITRLRNYTTYHVVVAAVDGFGNVGPPSPEICGLPQPVNDFWKDYRQDGGGAGGFCALEAVGAPGQSMAGIALALSTAAIVRRRRRRAS